MSRTADGLQYGSCATWGPLTNADANAGRFPTVAAFTAWIKGDDDVTTPAQMEQIRQWIDTAHDGLVIEVRGGRSAAAVADAADAARDAQMIAALANAATDEEVRAVLDVARDTHEDLAEASATLGQVLALAQSGGIDTTEAAAQIAEALKSTLPAEVVAGLAAALANG